MKKFRTSQILFFIGLMLLIFVVYPFVLITSDTNLTSLSDTPPAAGGVLDVSVADFSKPVALDGEWDFFPGAWQTPDALPAQASHFRRVPVTTLPDAEDKATYRLRLVFGENIPALALHFPHLDSGFRIYVNGALLLDGLEPMPSGATYSQGNFLLDLPFDADRPYQEIVVCANQGEREALFFNTQMVMGARDQMTVYTQYKWGLSFNILGIMMALLICCLLFVIIRPHDAPNTARNLFNTLMIVHIIVSTVELYQLLSTTFGYSVISTDMFARLQWATLIPVGISFNHVIATLYRGGRLWLGARIVMCLYAAASLLLFLVPAQYTADLLRVVFWIYLADVVMITYYIAEALVNRFSRSLLLRTAEVFYLMVLLTTRMLVLTGQSAFLTALSVGYIPLFLYHIALYISQYNRSVKKVEHLNNTLEDAVENRTQQLLSANRRLSDLSVRDALTGAYNRLYFETNMQYLLETGAPTPQELTPFYLCMMDIDFFKTINDTYGHDAGDIVLVDFVSVLSKNIGESGVLARIGGEEFVTILRQGTPSEVFQKVDAWRQAVEAHSFLHGVRVTASFGIAVYTPGMSVKALFRLADQMLYTAKNAGRNRVCISGLNDNVDAGQRMFDV